MSITDRMGRFFVVKGGVMITADEHLHATNSILNMIAEQIRCARLKALEGDEQMMQEVIRLVKVARLLIDEIPQI